MCHTHRTFQEGGFYGDKRTSRASEWRQLWRKNRQVGKTGSGGFLGPWCGPCKAIGPFIEELAESYKDRAVIAKINVDESKNAASAYGVRSIPTLILFKGGKVFDTIIGLVPKERLEELINKALQTWCARKKSGILPLIKPSAMIAGIVFIAW
jgi:thioredoxin 1